MPARNAFSSAARCPRLSLNPGGGDAETSFGGTSLPHPRSLRCLALAAALLAFGPGCGEPVRDAAARPSPDPAASADPLPPVVLVTIDTLRADHVSAYGYPRPTTPNLDALAAAGARFEAAYAVSSTTLPSHATLFTSRDPGEHGVLKNGWPLPDDVPTLAEAFRAAGYETAAFVSSFVVERRFGLARGFDHYDDEFGGADHSSPIQSWEGHTLDAPYDRRGAETTARALAWLAARDASRPFFLWVHYFDPHSPYDPPEPHRTRFLASEPADARAHTVDLYDGDVHYADHELGRLLRTLAPHAPLTIVTSDHGEGLWDHGVLEHGVFLYEEMVRVPLVVHWPGRIAPGTRIGGLAAHVDVVPTLAGLLGRTLLGEPRGRDLSPQLLGRAEPDPARAVHLQRRHYEPTRKGHLRIAGPKHAIRQGDWKLILSPAELGMELFDLARDPGELHNLAGLHPQRTSRLHAELAAWQARQGTRSAAPAEVAPEVRERLRALGYVD
jgi:arylsulfatase A-like enzyme